MGADQCAMDLSSADMPPCSVSGMIGIGEGSVLRNCVVDKNVSIGKDCHILNKEGVQEGGSEAEGFFIRSGVCLPGFALSLSSAGSSGEVLLKNESLSWS